MPQQHFVTCIQACYECAKACHHCAASCLQEPDIKAMARCIALDRDCAQVCELAAALIGRSSSSSVQVGRICAELCEACGPECARHAMAHCQECAQACSRCAQACRTLVAET